LAAQRGHLVTTILKPMLGHYERLSKRHPGSVVSDATNGRCGGCHLELRPQLYQELRSVPDVLFCENCKRILYYNPPVEFDTATGAPAPGDPRLGSRVDMT
jgi:hypothetical protein